jgi:hypothetical protein
VQPLPLASTPMIRKRGRPPKYPELMSIVLDPIKWRISNRQEMPKQYGSCRRRDERCQTMYNQSCQSQHSIRLLIMISSQFPHEPTIQRERHSHCRIFTLAFTCIMSSVPIKGDASSLTRTLDCSYPGRCVPTFGKQKISINQKDDTQHRSWPH